MSVNIPQEQADVLAIIERSLETQGQAPTVREIMAESGASSTVVVHYQLRLLEERGLIRIRKRVARGIELA